jgi:hypothetical protein
MLVTNWRWFERIDRRSESSSEGKDGRQLEAVRDHARVIHGRLLVEIVERGMLADDNCKITGWVKKYLIALYPRN